jgi:hypothetical protein
MIQFNVHIYSIWYRFNPPVAFVVVSPFYLKRVPSIFRCSSTTFLLDVMTKSDDRVYPRLWSRSLFPLQRASTPPPMLLLVWLLETNLLF